VSYASSAMRKHTHPNMFFGGDKIQKKKIIQPNKLIYGKTKNTEPDKHFFGNEETHTSGTSQQETKSSSQTNTRSEFKTHTHLRVFRCCRGGR